MMRAATLLVVAVTLIGCGADPSATSAEAPLGMDSSAGWKMKRAVRFAFLDFSTAEKRRADCEAELTLNRRTAPDLYLGVVPLTREADGALALGGRGPAVDWLVEMLELPDAFRSSSSGGGVIQDTASSATLCALLAARDDSGQGLTPAQVAAWLSQS